MLLIKTTAYLFEFPIFLLQDGTFNINGTGVGGSGFGSVRNRPTNPGGSRSNSCTTAPSNKSRPKYLETWGDADKPFANITENNATAKSTGLMVRKTFQNFKKKKTSNFKSLAHHG